MRLVRFGGLLIASSTASGFVCWRTDRHSSLSYPIHSRSLDKSLSTPRNQARDLFLGPFVVFRRRLESLGKRERCNVSSQCNDVGYDDIQRAASSCPLFCSQDCARTGCWFHRQQTAQPYW